MLFAFDDNAGAARAGGHGFVRWLCGAALLISLEASAVGLGGGLSLYDASSAALPNEDPWSWQFVRSDLDTVVGMTTSATVLDTTASSGAAGYGQWIAGGLNSAGFTLDFSLRIEAETHANVDRSGFSMIVLNEAARGVELSFWTDRVWTKNADPGFSHGESTSVDTQSHERMYRLTFAGDQYALTTDGAVPLAGTLRNYAPAAASLGPLPGWIYSQPSFIAFGDNTGSGSAFTELSMMSLAPIPEPAEWALMLAGLGCVAAVARRRRSHASAKR